MYPPLLPLASPELGLTQQQSTGAIAGVVFEDLDADGVQDGGEAALANRRV